MATSAGPVRTGAVSALLVATLALFAGCGSNDDGDAEATANPGKLTKVTFALPLPPNLSLAGYVVTKEEGIFEKHGLDVTFAPGSTGIEQVGLLQRGRAEFASFDIIGQCDVLNAQDFKMLGVYVYEPKTFLQVFSLADGDYNHNSDLAGKKIGVTSLESGTVITAKAALGGAGLTESDVEMVPVANTAIAALLSGRVDVLSQYDQVSAAIEQRGEEVHQFGLGAYEDVPGNTVFTTEEYAQENPDVVTRFVAALQEGEEWTAENSEEATQVVLDALPEQAQEAELATAQVKARIDHYAQLPGQPFGAFDEERFQRGLDAVAKLGALDKPCDLRPLWTNEFVEQAAGQ